MTPTFRSRTRAIDVLTLVCVVALIVCFIFAQQDVVNRLSQLNLSMDAVTAHLMALDGRGASVTNFNFPEAKSPYINFDQKDYNRDIQEVSNGPAKIPKPSGGSKKGG